MSLCWFVSEDCADAGHVPGCSSSLLVLNFLPGWARSQQGKVREVGRPRSGRWRGEAEACLRAAECHPHVMEVNRGTLMMLFRRQTE